MESENKNKRVGVFVYEFLGTAFIMYALMLARGTFSIGPCLMTLIMMLVAWDISGAHFNPAISLGMFVANKKWGQDLLPLLIMVVAQMAGAFFGVLLGYLSLLDGSWAETFDSTTEPFVEAKVPGTWLGVIAPRTPNGTDLGTLQLDGSYEYTRNWQTFWGMFVSSIILVLCFASIKSKETALSDNKLFGALAIYTIIESIASINTLFGSAGFNPALASGYIFFETTQFNYPNTVYTSGQLNHYWWAYALGPMAGGFVGGILFLIHSKCANSKGGSDEDSSADGLLTSQ